MSFIILFVESSNFVALTSWFFYCIELSSHPSQSRQELKEHLSTFTQNTLSKREITCIASYQLLF